MSDHQTENAESAYVVVELEGVPLPAAGAPLRLEGLDTAEPRLYLDDGTILVGEFQETVGTQMVFKEEIVDEDDEGGKRVELACHTDKKIKFRKIS